MMHESRRCIYSTWHINAVELWHEDIVCSHDFVLQVHTRNLKLNIVLFINRIVSTTNKDVFEPLLVIGGESMGDVVIFWGRQ